MLENIILYVINTAISIAVGCLIKQYRDSKQERDQLKEDNEILKAGFQAMLRSSMIKDYNHCLEKGYMPINEKDSFEAVYQAYHRMGSNGVMDGVHKEVMAMPTGPSGDKQ